MALSMVTLKSAFTQSVFFFLEFVSHSIGGSLAILLMILLRNERGGELYQSLLSLIWLMISWNSHLPSILHSSHQLILW